MRPGDIVRLRAELLEHAQPVIVVDISDDYVKVLMDGRLVWMPTSFVVWDVESVNEAR